MAGDGGYVDAGSEQRMVSTCVEQLLVHDSRIFATQLAAALPRTLAGHLRAQRLQELQRAAEARSRLQQAGHGGLAVVPESRLLREAEGSAAPLVAHLAWEGSVLDDELDEHLGGLAHRHLGTRFVRTVIGPRSTLHLRLRTPPGPGVLVARRGGGGQAGAGLGRAGGWRGAAQVVSYACRMLPARQPTHRSPLNPSTLHPQLLRRPAMLPCRGLGGRCWARPLWSPGLHTRGDS